ncbi:MAG TPA: hypothetical protein ENO20_08400 [Bacteroides sp.]|nr:hypothetical protein [Bacteroides sp.]
MKTEQSKRTIKIIAYLAIIMMVPFFVASCEKEEEPDPVDLSELETLVTTAEDYIATAQEGNVPGDYVRGSLADLEQAVDEAKLVVDDPPESQEEIADAVTVLEDAIYAFEAMEIEDVALQFGLTDSTIAVENSAGSAESFNLSEFTFETWVIYYDKPGFFGQIVSTEFYEDGLRGWNLRVGDNDALDFTIADGNESRLQPLEGATVPRNTWTHVACTFNGEYMRSYINGQMVGEVEASDRDSIFVTSTLENAQPLTFGNSAGFAQPERRLIGRLFDIRIWDVARSQAEIQADKDYILSGDQENLIAYWPFARNTAETTIADATSSFNLELKNGTVTSTRE